MRIDLKNIKLLKEENPWQIDFRDAALASNATFNAIRIYIIYGLVATTLLFSILCVFGLFENYSKQSEYERQKGYITQHTHKIKQMMALNQSFVQQKNELLNVIQNYTPSFNILKFLSELAGHKGESLRFSNISIKDNKDVNSNKLLQSIEIQLSGILKEDVAFLDGYKDEILEFSSLQAIEKGCKGFLQIVNNNIGKSEEIKFQLNVQSNE